MCKSTETVPVFYFMPCPCASSHLRQCTLRFGKLPNIWGELQDERKYYYKYCHNLFYDRPFCL